MSWHYSLALVEEFSERGLLVTASSVRLKTNRTASRSCFGGKRMGASTPSQSGMTSDHLTVNLGMASSMSCLLDSPANPSPKQDSNEEKTTTETFGLIQRESLARYDQELSSWRTHPDCFGSTEPLSSATLPVSATTVGGQLYPLVPPGRDTFGSDGGAWPTPTVNTRPNEGNVRLLRKQVLEGDLTEAEATSMLNGKSPFSAQGAVPAWPTPTCGDSKSSGSFGYEKTSTHNPGMTLCDATERGLRDNEWPTPRASNPGSRPNGKGGKILDEEVKIAEGVRVRGEKWPTPQSRDWKSGDGKRFPDPERSNDLNDAVDFREVSQGRLNPSWVEWLMGWPSGWTSLDPLPEGTMEAWEASVKAGTYWDTDPADTGDVPRLTEKKENRASRLKAIGNGQVPAQILLAWEVLGEGRRKNG